MIGRFESVNRRGAAKVPLNKGPVRTPLPGWCSCQPTAPSLDGLNEEVTRRSTGQPGWMVLQRTSGPGITNDGNIKKELKRNSCALWFLSFRLGLLYIDINIQCLC